MVRKAQTDKKAPEVSSAPPANLDIHRVLATIPILNYHRVADIGCGEGLLAIPLGKYLFDGKIFAIDSEQRNLDATKVAFDKIRLTNVELLLLTRGKVPLEDGGMDGVMMAFSLRDAADPTAAIEEAKRLLRKGGWLTVLDWRKTATEEGPPPEKRIAEEDVRDMADKLGFRLTARLELDTGQYLLVLRK